MTRRWVLVPIFAQGLALACDSTSTTGVNKEPVPSGPTYTVTPSGLTATAIAWNEIDISWPKGSNAATGFEVFRSNNGVAGAYIFAGTVAASVTSYPDVGRSASTQYCYEIRSYKTAGKNTSYSLFSAPACATTFAPPVNAPSQVDVVPTGSSSASISWVDNSSNENGFRIESANAIAGPWTQVATAAANATTISQTVVAEHVVCFRVIAFNAVGPSSPSLADCATSPAAPAKLTLMNSGQLSVQLGWQDNSAVEDGYIVSRFQSLTGWTTVAKLDANATGFTDTRVGAGEKYTYRVLATKDGGYSDNSNELTVTLSDVGEVVPPAAPSGIAVSYFADNSYGWLYFNAAWTDASENEDGFRIEVSGDGVTDWVTYATTDANATTFAQQMDLWNNLAPISQCFRVIAFIGNVSSKPSNVACTDWNRPPTDLAATAIDQQTIRLTWTDNANYELGYFIFRSTAVDGDYEFVGQVPANTTTYTDGDLAIGQEYWYLVILYRDSNVGNDAFDYSDRVSATTLSGAAVGGASGSLSVGPAPSRIVKRSLRGRPIVKGKAPVNR
jgi:hypothetical protein